MMDWILAIESCQPAQRAAAAQVLITDDWDGIRAHVYRLALALTLNQHQAEDLAQEALIRVWQGRERMQAADDPKAWINRVVINRAKSFWRTRRSLIPWASCQELPAEPDADLSLLRSVVEGLPAVYRDVILLLGVYGASYDEAARLLDVPSGTVASRFARAKTLLRQAWREE
jgi:RNA polymerase sigma-70 factor (ECF subfamily)